MCCDRLHRAVLVAIAIPIYTNQLEKSRDAVTVSNLRAAYAEAATDVLTNNTTSATKDVVSKGTKEKSGEVLSGLAGELPFTFASSVSTSGLDKTPKTYKVTFTFDGDACEVTEVTE